mgnify:CR=1 FL=1
MAGDPDEGNGKEYRKKIVARRVWTRVTRGWKECTVEIGDREGRESAMMRKDWDRGRKDFHQVLKNGLEFEFQNSNRVSMAVSKGLLSQKKMQNLNVHRLSVM